MSSKCIVEGCVNWKHQGLFIGDLCAPCHYTITTGVYNPSESFLYKTYEDLIEAKMKIKKLEKKLEEKRG